MQLSKYILSPAVFVLAAIVATVAAWISVGVIENASRAAVEKALIIQGEDWADVDTDGLQVMLSGMAPTETDRFQALSIAGGEVDSARVIDNMEVLSAQAIAPPRFSIEILRNDAGISMIGLVPAATDREALSRRIARIGEGISVTDLLESADYDVPARWGEVLDYAIYALEELPRSKISMDADRVEIEAIADSAAQKTNWEQELARRAPSGLRVALNISAPRPVVTPFTARFVIDETGPRFDACTAGTEAGRTRILSAARAIGVEGVDCVVGLGEPSSDWPDAVATAVRALGKMGQGSVTFSDADVAIVAAESVDQATFDTVVGELEADLPELYSLHSTKTAVAVEGAEGGPDFTATLSPEGLVQLRGRLASEQERTIAESVARARFGVDNVYMAARLDDGLPPGWSVRVLAALEALAYLDNGAAIVSPSLVELRGKTGDKDANREISRLLSSKLGESSAFRVNVVYEEALDPAALLLDPAECVAEINTAILVSKITFAPGSVEIDATSGDTIDKIAEILKKCPEAFIEIGGHTDSDGSEDMNKALSQQRANSVLNALLARRVLTSNLQAHGYGEEQPIADNDTEEGREENRRIAFRVIGLTELPPELGGTAPLVVDPDLAGKRPKPRPVRDEARGEVPAPETSEDATQEAPEEEVTDELPQEDVTEEGMDEAPQEELTDEETAEAPEEEPAPEEAPEESAENASQEAPETPADAPASEEPTEATDTPEAEPAPETATESEAVPAEEATADEAPADEATPEVVPPTETPEAPAEEPAPEPAQTSETPDTSPPAPDTPEQSTVPLGPPVVVHPDLEGVRPPTRPDR